MYLKAEISTYRQAQRYNATTDELEEYGPEETLGVTEEVMSVTPLELRQEIEKRYFNLAKPIGADVQITPDGVIEITYAGEHDYRTPIHEQTPFMERVEIRVYEVEYKFVNINHDETFKDVAR